MTYAALSQVRRHEAVVRHDGEPREPLPLQRLLQASPAAVGPVEELAPPLRTLFGCWE